MNTSKLKVTSRCELWEELKEVEEQRYRFSGTVEEWREYCKKAFFGGKSVGDHLLETEKALNRGQS